MIDTFYIELHKEVIVSRYQTCHPNLNIQKWSQVDISKFSDLIKTHSFDEVMLRKGIEILKFNKELMIVNLGTLRIDIEQTSEIEPVIKVLKKTLTK